MHRNLILAGATLPIAAVLTIAASPVGRGGVDRTQASFAPLTSAPGAVVAEHYEDAKGWARLDRHASYTEVRVKLKGLAPDTTYPAHLHDGDCDETLGGHYMDDRGGAAEPPNELWPVVETDAKGRADVTVRAPWSTGDVPLSVVVHHHAAGDDGKKAKVLCADV